MLFESLQPQSTFFANCGGYNSRRIERWFDGKEENMAVFLAKKDESIAGVLFLWNLDNLPELGIAVADASQGCGIGTMLMQAAEQFAAQAGLGAIFLSTHPANVHAQGLYRKMHYEYIGTSRSGEFLFLRRIPRKKQKTI